MRFTYIACLLACTSCATSFPFENLEEDMTMAAVQEEFGSPVAEEPDCLTYWHESQNWFFTLHPFAPLIIPFFHWMEGITWSEAARDVYITEEPVLISFEEDGLASWELAETIITSTVCEPLIWTYGPDPTGKDSWHWEGGGCTETTAYWPPTPTCTRVRTLRDMWK